MLCTIIRRDDQPPQGLVIHSGPHALSVPRTRLWRTLISRARRNPSCKHGLNRFPIHQTDCPLLNTPTCRSLSSLFLLPFCSNSSCRNSSIIDTTCAVVAAIKLSSGDETWCSFPCTKQSLSRSRPRPSAPRRLWCSRHLSRKTLFAAFGVEFSTRAFSNARRLQRPRYLRPRQLQRTCSFWLGDTVAYRSLAVGKLLSIRHLGVQSHGRQ